MAAYLSDDQIHTLGRDAGQRAASGDFAGAEPLFARIVEQRPNSGQALHYLGQVRLKLGRYAEAREPLERAAKFLPREATAHINLAGCLARLGEHAAAIDALERAERLKPGDATISCNKGRAFEALGRKADAERAYDTALSFDHRLFPALAGRANLLAERGEWAAALSDLDAALTIQPTDPRLRARRAMLLLGQGDWLRGLAEHEARLELPHDEHWTCPLPPWDGEDRAGRVLLYPEQADIEGGAALRDTLLLMRGRLALAANGIAAALQAAPGFDLLVGTRPNGQFDRTIVAWRDDPGGNFTAAAPLRSLPHLLGWTLDKLPPPTLIPAFAFPEAQGEDARAPRRGLRRMPRAHIDFEPGQSNPPNPRLHVGWLAGEAPHLAAVAAKNAVWLERFDLAAALGTPDGSGLRALARNLYRCDFVVGDDVWATHLAALLGLPVLMLLPRRADWLWGLKAGATPWYPTVELLREDEHGWTTAVRRLETLMAQASSVESWREAPDARWEPGQS
jgi:tetratricopeptide (TPR) repeat protein